MGTHGYYPLQVRQRQANFIMVKFVSFGLATLAAAKAEPGPNPEGVLALDSIQGGWMPNPEGVQAGFSSQPEGPIVIGGTPMMQPPMPFAGPIGGAMPINAMPFNAPAPVGTKVVRPPGSAINYQPYQPPSFS